MRHLFSLLLLLTAIACATPSPDNYSTDLGEPEIAEDATAAEREPMEQKPEVPAFVPVKDVKSPLQTKVVSISARNTPLRDVLYTIAEAASLNLVMERGVNAELPVTMTFRDLNIEDALNIVSNSADYFYTVKDNILIVQATSTELFELGQPNVIQDFKIDLGGDILSGTSSGGAGSNSVSGDVSMKSSSDAASYQFWTAMEKTLETLISTGHEGEKGTQSKFVVNRMTGTIMVTATKRDLEKVRTYIHNLKLALNRQVLIEARIVEVQLSEGLKFGIDWNAVGRWFTEDFVKVSTNNFTSIFSPSTPHLAINIVDTNDFNLLLKALQEQGDVKTLSNPRVNIMNGQTSLLSVGRNTTFISKVETTTTSSDASGPITTFTVETNSILSGIMFGLVPYINREGEITLTITPIITNLIDLEQKTIGSGDNQVEIKLPIVDLREMSTTVKVVDGKLIVIGGLIDKKEIRRENKVPLIGDIPFFGTAFKSIDKSYENTELVVMLIPRLLN